MRMKNLLSASECTDSIDVMRAPHPIPYQGSKRLLAPAILTYFPRNPVRLVEPFAGAAGVSIAAVLTGHAHTVVLNDINKPLMRLWKSIIRVLDDTFPQTHQGLIDIVQHDGVCVTRQDSRYRDARRPCKRLDQSDGVPGKIGQDGGSQETLAALIWNGVRRAHHIYTIGTLAGRQEVLHPHPLRPHYRCLIMRCLPHNV